MDEVGYVGEECRWRLCVFWHNHEDEKGLCFGVLSATIYRAC